MGLGFNTNTPRAASRSLSAHHTEASGKRDNGLWRRWDTDGEYAFDVGDQVIVIDPRHKHYNLEGTVTLQINRSKFGVNFGWMCSTALFHKSQLRKINKKCTPQSNIISFEAYAYRLAQNKIRMAQKVTHTAAVIALPAVSQSTAHERFVAFMTWLDQTHPLTEADRAVKLVVEPVEKPRKTAQKAVSGHLYRQNPVKRHEVPKMRQNAHILDYPTLRVRKVAS